MHIRSALTLFAALLLLSGCGGGGSGSSGVGGGGDVLLGPMTVQMAGSASSKVATTSANVTVLGLSGASFSKVQLNLPPITQANAEQVRRATRIAYVDTTSGAYIYNYATAGSYRLLSPEQPFKILDLSFIGKTNKIALETATPTAYGLAIINVDGTGFKQLVINLGYLAGLSGSPDGTKIVASVYDNAHYYSLFIITLSGMVTRLTTGVYTASDTHPDWMPDGRIAFIRNNAGNNRVFAINPDGSGLTDLSKSDALLSSLAVSPTQKSKALIVSDGGSTLLEIQPLSGSIATYAETLNTGYATSLDWSPDGNDIVYAAYSSGAWSVMLATLANAQDQVLVPDAYAASWGPYIDRWTFVGSGGILLPSAAGFLFTQTGQNVNAILAFDAVTRTTAQIADLNTPGGGSNLIYDVTADTLKSLRYANSLTSLPVTVIDPAKSATYVKGAIVSFDAQTGLVAAVVTHDANGAVARSKDGTRLQGGFLDLYDSKGNHRSLRGLTEVKVNAATGAIAP